MKRIYIFIVSAISLIAMSLPSKAYEPTVREDRVWHYSEYNVYQGDRTENPDAVYRFNGSKDINGTTYSVLVDSKQDTVALMRENDHKIYAYLNNVRSIERRDETNPEYTEYLVYDFDAQPGDSIAILTSDRVSKGSFYLSNAVIKSVDQIKTGECRRIRQTMRIDDQVTVTVVEGIGCDSGWLFAPHNGIRLTGSLVSDVEAHLTYVCDNAGSSIFKANDFKEAGFGGTHEFQVSAPNTSDSRKYDLMGREIKEPAPGTVYIQGGRKLIAR